MAQKQQGAVAVFVETPGLRNIKPLLCTSIGKDAAEEFYMRSVATTVGSLRQANNELTQTNNPVLEIFWSPFEEEAKTNPLWEEYPVISQGPGGQGEKLHHVYSTLLSSFSFVIMVYGDSPQLSPQLYAKIAGTFYQPQKAKDFIVGPSEYGGYYLFAGRKEIPEKIWTSVPYDNKEALNMFINALINVGNVGWIEMQPTIDGIKDISRLKGILNQSGNLTPEQMELRQWLNKVVK